MRNPKRILADDAYWNVAFLRRYLMRCDEVAVHEPRRAYEISQPVIELAEHRIGVGGRPGSYCNEIESRSCRVEARAIRAVCARRVGKLDEAEGLYLDAFRLATEPISTDTRAKLHTRYGWLLFVQGHAGAIEQAAEAASLASHQPTHLAAALVLRGAAVYRFENQAGVEYFAQALSLSKGDRATKYGRRVFYAALHGLAKVLGDCHSSLQAQYDAYLLLQEVKSYLGNRPKSVAKMQVYWQLGRIAWNLGYNRHGPRLLRKSRKGFAELGEPFELALSSLDLAGFYLHNGEFAEYEALVQETLTLMERFDEPQLKDALTKWPQTLRSPAQLQPLRAAAQRPGDGEPPF